MAVRQRNNVSYGLTDALLGVPSFPISSKRDPNGRDKAQLGTVWVNTSSNDAFILTSVVADTANWVGVGGGAGNFTNITATGTITANGGITSVTGNIRGEGIYAQGDSGAEVGVVGLTNVNDDTQGVGVMTILSTNGNAGDNAGFIKVYVDGITAWIPYFDDIAP